MADRRTELLRAGYDLLGREGLEAFSARALALHLKVNHATIHYYFPTRKDLLCGIAEYAREQLLRDRERFVQEAEQAVEVIESDFSLAEAYCRSTSRLVKVLVALFAASVKEPELRQKVTQVWTAWRDALHDANLNLQVKRKSEFAPDAELLVASLLGLGFGAHLRPGEFDPGPRLDALYGWTIGS